MKKKLIVSIVLALILVTVLCTCLTSCNTEHKGKYSKTVVSVGSYGTFFVRSYVLSDNGTVTIDAYKEVYTDYNHQIKQIVNVEIVTHISQVIFYSSSET